MLNLSVRLPSLTTTGDYGRQIPVEGTKPVVASACLRCLLDGGEAAARPALRSPGSLALASVLAAMAPAFATNAFFFSST